MRAIHFSLFALLSLQSAGAQSGSSLQINIASPVAGFAYDSTLQAVRPIQGFPGAAMLGAPLDLGFPLAAAAISPQQDFTLAVSAASRQVLLVRFAGDVSVVVPLADSMAAPDKIIVSPAGRAALLYQQSPARLQILTGLPDHPSLKDLDTAGLGSAPGAVAVGDDGAVLLSLGDDHESASIWVGPDGSSFPLPLPGPTAAGCFLRDSRDILAVTTAGDVYLIRNPGANAEYQQVHVGDPQTSSPVAAQFSRDGTRAYIATASGTVAAFDLETGLSAVLSCDCTPTGLQPLKSGALFRLTDVSDLPLWLFDGSTTEPRIWFVPRDRTSPARQGRTQ